MFNFTSCLLVFVLWVCGGLKERLVRMKLMCLEDLTLGI